MNRKLLLASMGAALACGLAAASVEAAPASGGLIGAKAAGGLVQTAHYSDHKGRGPWWWHPRRWDGDDFRWRRWWWKKHHGRDHGDRRWSWQDDDRRGQNHNGWRSRRDW